jgi:hypothetical protein
MHLQQGYSLYESVNQLSRQLLFLDEDNIKAFKES